MKQNKWLSASTDFMCAGAMFITMLTALNLGNMWSLILIPFILFAVLIGIAALTHKQDAPANNAESTHKNG
jgi:hypothetical protein